MESLHVDIQLAKNPNEGSSQQLAKNSNMQMRKPLWWLQSYPLSACKYMQDPEQELPGWA